MPRIVVETVFVAGALLVILLTTLGGSVGAESVPLLGLYAYAGFRVIPSANRIVWLLSEIRVGSPAIDRVHADLVGTGGWNTRAAAVAAPCPLRDQLELERVSYAYEGNDRPVLADVSLTIRRGESVGIVGNTGIGKSTLVDLIVGLLEPTGGRICVDGADIRCLAGWQRQIGYVPQTIFLVDDTLRQNVALGVADADIDETRVRAALHRAQLDAFVAALPRALETVVGERGVRLSGGERQRIGIARALYHEPSVLVLDEATSALDSRTEAELAEAIDALRIHRTLIVVTHRLTTVRRCDRLVFLADGRVADVGTFDELATRNVAFRDMTVAGRG
jgi:ATP-binding cassette subfamily C protein